MWVVCKAIFFFLFCLTVISLGVLAVIGGPLYLLTGSVIGPVVASIVGCIIGVVAGLIVSISYAAENEPQIKEVVESFDLP